MTQPQTTGEIPLRTVILLAAFLGITAAAVVWFLERFETERMHREIGRYLANYDAFREWLRAGGREGGQQT